MVATLVPAAQARWRSTREQDEVFFALWSVGLTGGVVVGLYHAAKKLSDHR